MFLASNCTCDAHVSAIAICSPFCAAVSSSFNFCTFAAAIATIFLVDFGDGLISDCFALEALRCSYICDCSPGFCGGEQLVQFLRLCGSARDSCFCFCC
jgi:hypothetical protein